MEKLMNYIPYIIPVVGVVGLVFAFALAIKIKKQDAGNEKMKEISSAIHSGAKAFLFAEYKILVFFIYVCYNIIWDFICFD